MPVDVNEGCSFDSRKYLVGKQEKAGDGKFAGGKRESYRNPGKGGECGKCDCSGDKRRH